MSCEPESRYTPLTIFREHRQEKIAILNSREISFYIYAKCSAPLNDVVKHKRDKTIKISGTFDIEKRKNISIEIECYNV